MDIIALLIGSSNQLPHKNPTIEVTSLVAQMVKCLPAMQETRVRSLGQEDPLEKEMQPTPVSCLESSMDGGA